MTVLHICVVYTDPRILPSGLTSASAHPHFTGGLSGMVVYSGSEFRNVN